MQRRCRQGNRRRIANIFRNQRMQQGSIRSGLVHLDLSQALMLDLATWIFVLLHCLSLFGALLTFYVINHPVDPLLSQSTHQGSKSTESSRHRLLKLLCINAIFISLMILIPGFLYQFQLQTMPYSACVLQGLSLNVAGLVDFALMLIIALQTWLLVVKRSMAKEYQCARYYYFFIFGVPLVVVASSALIWGSISEWKFSETSSVGIQPQPGFCFWSSQPLWLYMYTSKLWIALMSVPGIILSVLTTLYLVRQRRQHLQLMSTTAISKSIIHRTALLCGVYIAMAVLSLVPPMEAQQSHLGVGVFSTALSGLSLLLVFASGRSGIGRWFVKPNSSKTNPNPIQSQVPL